MSQLTYLQAVVIGLLQGVTELFPISSLGHSVLIPALIGGSWARTLDMTATGSPYLAFLVAVHVATAAALVVFFRRDWIRIGSGLLTSLRHRQITTPQERLAWLLIVATVPVGVAGVALDRVVRTTLGRPVPAAAFLALNGVVLFAVERLRTRDDRQVAAGRPDSIPAFANAAVPGAPMRPGDSAERDDGSRWEELLAGGGGAADGGVSTARRQNHQVAARRAGTGAHGGGPSSDLRLGRLGWGEAIAIGAAQILALLPGISRSGTTITAGLLRGLDHEDAARFAFLLATPVIAAAGVFKLPDLLGPAGQGIHGQVLAGSLVAGVSAYLCLRWLTRYFETHTLTPFAIYCAVAGTAALAWFGLG